MPPDPETSEILVELAAGNAAAAAKLMPLVYDELRRLAASLLAAERPDHTLQATALVHEAYLRLVDQTKVDWKSRAHFRAVAAKTLRRVLVDHARAHAAEKRGRGRERVTLSESVALSSNDRAIDCLDLDESLKELETLDPRQALIAERRFFGGMTVEEIAHVLDVSDTTVKNESRVALAWLRRRLASAVAS